jgi:hypothetical protein
LKSGRTLNEDGSYSDFKDLVEQLETKQEVKKTKHLTVPTP